MLARSSAVHALASEAFDVLVIGGGITGAGVALDAATRGYSRRAGRAGRLRRGTSSRSSKLVHGGLRYLQNFDLGLVREALLERQINVALAPHLVRPLPLVVPAFDGARPDRADRARAEHVRRDGGRPAAALAAGAAACATATGRPDWSPARHRVISGAEVAELLPALAAARAHRRLPVLRLPDRRRRGSC